MAQKKLNTLRGKQISLRLPKVALEKLERLAAKSVQTKGQWITRMVLETPE